MIPQVFLSFPSVLLAWLSIWITVVFFLCLMLYLVRSRRPLSFPPGPINLGFLGNFLQLSPSAPHRSLMQLGKKYGNIFSLNLGGEFLVVLDGYSIIREALVHHGEVFSARPISPLFLQLNGSHGITFSNGNEWREQHHFAVSHLRNLLAQVKPWLVSEARRLNGRFAEHHGKPFDPSLDISWSVYSAMYKVLFSHHPDHSEAAIREFMQCSMNIMSVLPSVSVKKSGDENSTFTLNNLVACTTDLIMGGTETIVSVLRWLLLYMTVYPSIQEKVHHEIDVMIGQHKEPSWMDRVKLPYTNAVIHEALRLGNVIPLNIPRQTTKDVQLRGYRIPKGTTVIPSLTGVLFDGKHWKSPNSFNPNRYLAENGQFHQVDAHLPFSTGHRMCIGVNLAQMETFLFFTFLMQRFQFTAAAGDLPMNLDGVYGATLAPHPYRICAYLRK
ncbi:cytochrome P450 2J1-like isoform X2 [Chiloscyllium punctatum]|uniref:cytochrome P450 2J1-like isoform X2 n=1 Tax=Chiloscyllium punctatum TaxID=137246 RepID=UPI003B636AD5